MKNNHPFHMVTLSPWPILMSISLMNLLMNMIMWMNLLNYSVYFLFLNILNMIFIMFQWMRDIIRESLFQGMHTFIVIYFLKFSMILFIISELFFFISFFWTYFHSSLSTTVEIGLLWPPKMIMMVNPYKIPLINSMILITSSLYVTISHYYLLMNDKKNSMLLLIYTIIMGIYFSILQLIEYFELSFCMNDSIFGSIFFLGTGFHGLHVFIGTLMLIISLMRLMYYHFSMIHHLNFEFSIWYWHFVDMIWLFLYMSFYWLFYYN